ncbi:MAG TPA: VCBS repeat-containing protein, partial [Calditrichia bacterium]|nr:VCBS repeat-containing protein [Calditrichia bacterium]
MKILFALPVFTAMFFLAACQKEQPAPTLFTRMDPGESGLDFRNEVFEDTLMNSINNLYFYDGGGVAIGDVNGDDLPDIYLTANLGENHLYLNRGGFRFEDVTARAGVGGGSDGWSTGTAMADLNGDGLLDIYVCRAHYLGKKGPNQLFINNGDGTFSEKAADLGLDFTGLSRQAAFLDYDRDGDLDIYLMNHSVHGKGTYGEITHIREKIDPEVGDQFFENRDGQFVNVTEKTGIYSNVLGYGLGVGVSDFNGDGYPDLYICNDFHEDDYLYYNNGDGTFTEG